MFQKMPYYFHFLKSWKCFIVMGGWVYGWVVIFYPLRFSSFSRKKTSTMYWLQKCTLKLHPPIRQNVMSILSFKNRKCKSDIPRGKRLKNLPTEKACTACTRRGNFVFFQKKCTRKTMISETKLWKILKVQKWH